VEYAVDGAFATEGDTSEPSLLQHEVDVGSIRQHLKQLDCYQNFLSFLGNQPLEDTSGQSLLQLHPADRNTPLRGGCLKEAFANMMKRVNKFVDRMAQISLSSEYAACMDFRTVQVQLDTLKKCCTSSSDGIANFLSNRTQDAYSRLIEQMQHDSGQLRISALKDVSANKFGPELTRIYRVLKNGQTLQDHVVTADDCNAVHTAIVDALGWSLNYVQSQLGEWRESMCSVTWDQQSVEITREHLDLVDTAITHLVDIFQVQSETAQAQEACQLLEIRQACAGTLGQLANQLIAETDSRLHQDIEVPCKAIKPISVISHTISNLKLVEDLVDEAVTAERRTKKCDDVVSYLTGIAQSCEKTLHGFPEQLSSMDCTVFAAKISLVGVALTVLPSVVATGDLKTVESLYCDTVASLIRVYSALASDVTRIQESDASAVFSTLAHMEDLHSALAPLLAGKDPALAKCSEKSQLCSAIREANLSAFTGLSEWMHTLCTHCCGVSSQSGVDNITDTDEKLQLLREYERGFEAASLPSLTSEYSIDAIKQSLAHATDTCVSNLRKMIAWFDAEHIRLSSDARYSDACTLTAEMELRQTLDRHLTEEQSNNAIPVSLPLFMTILNAAKSRMREVVKRVQDAFRAAMREENMEQVKDILASFGGKNGILKMGYYVDTVDDICSDMESNFVEKCGTFMKRIQMLFDTEDYEQLAKVMIGHAALTSQSEVSDYTQARELVGRKMQQHYEKAAQTLDNMKGKVCEQKLSALCKSLEIFERSAALSHEAALGMRVVSWSNYLAKKAEKAIRMIGDRGRKNVRKYNFVATLATYDELEQFTCVQHAAIVHIARSEGEELAILLTSKVEGTLRDIDQSIDAGDFNMLDQIFDGLQAADRGDFVSSLDISSLDGLFGRHRNHLELRLKEKHIEIGSALDQWQLVVGWGKLEQFKKIMRSQYAKTQLYCNECDTLCERFRGLTESLLSERKLLQVDLSAIDVGTTRGVQLQEALGEFKQINPQRFDDLLCKLMVGLQSKYQALVDQLTTSSVNLMPRLQQALQNLVKIRLVLMRVTDDGAYDVSELLQEFFLKAVQVVDDATSSANIALRNDKGEELESMVKLTNELDRILRLSGIAEQLEQLQQRCGLNVKEVLDRARAFKVDAFGLIAELGRNGAVRMINLKDPSTVKAADISNYLFNLRKYSTTLQGGLNTSVNEVHTHADACKEIKERMSEAVSDWDAILRSEDIQSQLILDYLRSFIELARVDESDVKGYVI
jgi:hypothetical protein